MKARVGQLVLLKNKNKGKSENEKYFAIIVNNSGIGIYQNLLFTELEIKQALNRAVKNPEDDLERSFLSSILD